MDQTAALSEPRWAEASDYLNVGGRLMRHTVKTMRIEAMASIVFRHRKRQPLSRNSEPCRRLTNRPYWISSDRY